MTLEELAQEVRILKIVFCFLIGFLVLLYPCGLSVMSIGILLNSN